jgi:CysZ protein
MLRTTGKRSMATDTDASSPGRASDQRVGFFAGLRYPFRGARFVFVEHPRLARFWIPPVLITAAAVVAVALLAVDWRGELLDAIWSSPTGEGWLATVARYLHSALGWVLAIAIFLIGVIAVALTSSVVAAPFNDALSEAVERIQGSKSASSLTLMGVLRDLRRTLVLECAKLSLYLVVMVPLFVLSLTVPVAGPAIYAVVAFYFTTIYFALDYVDWPASRRGLGLRKRIGLLAHHFGAMLGFGIGVWLFMYIPLLNLLFMPGAVAGGTLLFLDLTPQRQGSDARGNSEAGGTEFAGA